MTSPQESALTFLQSLLQQWGLESLNGAVSDMLTAGDSAEVIPIKLRQTEPYKVRFAGNAARVKAGYPALSEAEYLTTEASLKRVVQRYVGSGTYDTQSNVEKWIGSNFSPQELNERFTIWRDDYLRWGEEEKSWWAAHGLTPADAIAGLMDPSVDETTLKKKAQIYSLGAASVQAYRDDRALDQGRLGQLVEAGVTADRAAEGYRDVAARQDYEGFLARNAGTELTREDQENAALLKDSAAEQKRRKVLSTDQSQFNQNYLGGLSELARRPEGSY